MTELSSTEKGAVAELKIAAAAAELGIVVSRPMLEGRRYDLIFDVDHRLLRIQCKWANRRGDVVAIHVGTCRHSPTQGYLRTRYTAEEVEGIAAYCQDLDRCFFIPIRDFEGQTHLHLRLAPARNNQLVGVKLAADYPLGAVAQLGERCHGMAEVRGSSPLSSTARQAVREGGLSAFQADSSIARAGTSPQSCSRR